jgi:hypothetical protein
MVNGWIWKLYVVFLLTLILLIIFVSFGSASLSALHKDNGTGRRKR